MPSTDTLALKDSDLNTFLFAAIGTEQNGSTLTVLSTLARLDKDPWSQAAAWAKMPKAAAVDDLTRSILRMPLFTSTAIETRATAERLVALLPQQTGTIGAITGRPGIELKIPEWLPLIGFCVVVSLVVAAGTFAAPATTPAPPAAASSGVIGQ